MYGTINVNANATPTRFKGGINEKVKLTGGEIETTKNGNEVLAIGFVNPDGGTFKLRLWGVDKERVLRNADLYPRTHNRDIPSKKIVKGAQITPEQALEEAYNDYNRKIKHILTKYMSEEDAEISDSSSYKDYANQIISKLDKKYFDIEANIKLVYDKNNYLVLPRYGNFYELSGTDPSILSLTEYDKVVFTPSSEETVSAAVNGEQKTPNKLPF